MERLTDMYDSGLIPQIVENMHTEIVKEQDKYVLRRLMELDIDKDILINQVAEIKRLNAIIEKYNDLEEKGLLLQLPIALGAPCYVIETCKCGSHWNKCNPDNIRLKKAKAAKPYKTYGSMRYCFKVYERPFKLIYLGYYGKRVFATFEEAEAAMQNMEIREHYRHNL